jgi:glycosyltransferase involved in cell wall biosynthesis
MTVSVIFSTYNSEAWLEKVIIGFSVQTFKDFEIIIADDGSREATKDIIDKLNKEVNQALADPTVRAKFVELGAEPVVGPPEDLNITMASDIKKWTAIIKKGGITLEK